MIPSTPVGVALLLILVAPGLAYTLRREKAVPTGPRSAFREALQVIFVSVASFALIGLLATLTRVLAPHHTPNVRGLLLAPGPFAREHHVELAWWTFGLIVAATLLAWLMADPRLIRKQRHWSTRRPVGWLTGASHEEITEVSAWWRIFEEYKPPGTGPTCVGVLKDDGSYIQGTLVSFTAGGLDYDKRELILTAPLSQMTADGTQNSLPAQMVLIAGRNITRLDVTHLPAAAGTTASSTEQTNPAGPPP